MSARDELSAEQRATLAAQLGDTQPARASLLISFGKSVQGRREHDHTTQSEDWYCLNLAAYMGERAAAVLRRLLDAEARAERYLTAWKLCRTRALSLAGAADRYAARARQGQTALQDALVAILGAQVERDAARTTTLHQVDERLAAMQLPDHLKGTLNAGSYADAWRHCRDIVQAMADDAEREKGTSGGPQSHTGEPTPDFSGLLAHVTVFEIPCTGSALPLQLRRSTASGDRWAICDREGRRWHRVHGFVHERQDLREPERTDTRFPLAEAWPLAQRIAAGEAGT
ncbi:hypothetical protein [Streptomyces sp. NPDC051452]|uniref:hypothetical protein n=1 Tax=Streptomyces sp. NPDC051452 TaxID=3365654 RepID=UPI0037B2FB58